MAGFNIDQHLVARHNRLGTWSSAMGVTIIAFVANMYLVLAFAPAAASPAKIALGVLIVAITLYAILNTLSAVKELMAIREDKVLELTGTSYQKNYDAIPLRAFMLLSNFLYLATGLAQLWAIFTL